MRTFRDLAQLAIVLAILSLSIRLGGRPEAPNLKLTEVFIALATVLTIWYARSSSALLDHRVRIVLRSVYPFLAVFVASILLGTVASTLILESPPSRLAIAEYARIVVSAALFLLILFYGHVSRRFVVILYFVFLAPIVIAVLSWLPGAVEALGMTDGGTRFKGLFEDPNYFASFTLISALFLYSAILHRRGELVLRFLAIAALVLITSTLLWSGSRSGWLGLLAGLTTVAISTVRFSAHKWRTGAMAILLIIATLVGGFLLLPTMQQTDMFARAGISYEFREASPDPADGDLRLHVPSISVGQVPLAHGQDRINIWRQVLEYFRANPLGYGPGYYQTINIESAGERRSSHSIIFEAMATGGILALILLTYLAYLTVRLWVRRTEEDYVWTGIYAAFIGVLVSSLFLDSMSLRWLWALGAMLICYSLKDTRTEQALSR